MCGWICGSQEEFESVRAKLKTTACPHCKSVGNLIRHGFLRGYDDKHQRERTVRAWRIFCSNRNRATGCGRTFSVWAANKVKRLFLTADSLWSFLKQAVSSGNKLQAFRKLNSGLSDSAPYRIWKRFHQAQCAAGKGGQAALRQSAQYGLRLASTEGPEDHRFPALALFRICLG